MFLAEKTASPKAVRFETIWYSLRKHWLVWCDVSKMALVTISTSPGI